jgi:hypothetical protein
MVNSSDLSLLSRDKQLSIPVLLEVPTEWLVSKRDGERNCLMFDNLKKSLVRQELDICHEPIPFGQSFREIKAPDGGFTLSYHSVGNSPNVWRIKETPIQYFYSFDRFGFSGWSDLALRPNYHRELIEDINLTKAFLFTDNLREELIKSNSSKYKQSNIPFESNEPFIFYPLQMRNDVVAKLNRFDPLIVLHKAAFLAKKFRTRLIVKRHPYCRNPWVSWALWKAKLNNPFVSITSASIHKILPNASKVLVANSGVGLEALIHGKQVFSFARSEYELATHRIDSLDELERVFLSLQFIDNSWMDRFIYYFLNECCFDARNTDCIDVKLNMVIKILNDEWPKVITD